MHTMDMKDQGMLQIFTNLIKEIGFHVRQCDGDKDELGILVG